MRKILFGHPLGNPNAKEAAIALHEAGLLDGVATSFAYSERSALASLVRSLPGPLCERMERQLSRRAWLPAELPKYSRTRVSELGYSAGLAFARNCGPTTRSWFADSLYHAFDAHLASELKRRSSALSAVYLYEDGAARSFAIARHLGLRCFYDLPTAHHAFTAKLFRQEAEAYPEFHKQLVIGDSTAKRDRKREELSLADAVVVASSFAAESLRGEVECSVSVVPYGAPIEGFAANPGVRSGFRALYVGRMSPRKGVHYLLEAWQRSQLPQDELELVGIDDFPEGWLKRSVGGARYSSAVPHAELIPIYQRANVFVFPTLSDGFGLVLLEAMASGLPIIATRNSGAADLIREGIEGFVVPIRRPEALAERLVWCRENPEALVEMGRAARRRAEDFSWKRYRTSLAGALQEAMTKGGP